MKAMRRASSNFLYGAGYSVTAVADCSNIRTLSSLNGHCLGNLFLCGFTPCVITDFITWPFITSYQKDSSVAYTREWCTYSKYHTFRGASVVGTICLWFTSGHI